MPFLAIVIGAILIAMGLQSYYDFGNYLGVETKFAPTALIPAYFGGALALLGLIALTGSAPRKHAMHLAAMVGLVGIIGGAFRPVKAWIDGAVDWQALPTRMQLAMAVLCLIFVLFCVQSFVNARRVRGFGER